MGLTHQGSKHSRSISLLREINGMMAEPYSSQGEERKEHTSGRMRRVWISGVKRRGCGIGGLLIALLLIAMSAALSWRAVGSGNGTRRSSDPAEQNLPLPVTSSSAVGEEDGEVKVESEGTTLRISVDETPRDEESRGQMTRVALCFFGLARSLRWTFPSIKSRVLDVLRDADVAYDIFVHTYNVREVCPTDEGREQTSARILKHTLCTD